MEAKVVKFKNDYQVVVEHKQQSFHISYEGTEEECTFIAQCFNDALENHSIGFYLNQSKEFCEDAKKGKDGVR